MLAAHADPEGSAEAELAALIEVRAHLSHQIGRASMQVLASGGTIRATAGTRAVAEGTALPPAHEAPVTFPVVAERRRPEPRVELRSVPSTPVVEAAPAPGPTPAQREALKLHVKTIGMPAKVDSREQCVAAATRLSMAVVQMDKWLEQPQESQKALMGLASSLARQIQDETEYSLPYDADEALRAAFSRMTAWSREYRPGFVPGLSRSNAPDHGTWLDDGRHWWRELHRGEDPAETPGTPEHSLAQLRAVVERGIDDRKAFAEQVKAAVQAGLEPTDERLVALLAPHQSTLKGVRTLRTLRGALRQAFEDQEAAAEESSPADAIPKGWPLFFMTEGKRLAVLGGDPRPKALGRMREGFGFAEAQWPEPDLRSVLQVAEAASKHEVDMVVLLGAFLSTRIQDIVRPACQQAQVPLCLVDEGYGVLQVKQAMERYFADRVGGEE